MLNCKAPSGSCSLNGEQSIADWRRSVSCGVPSTAASAVGATEEASRQCVRKPVQLPYARHGLLTLCICSCRMLLHGGKSAVKSPTRRRRSGTVQRAGCPRCLCHPVSYLPGWKPARPEAQTGSTHSSHSLTSTQLVRSRTRDRTSRRRWPSLCASAVSRPALALPAGQWGCLGAPSPARQRRTVAGKRTVGKLA
jgi:hypothetical protein